MVKERGDRKKRDVTQRFECGSGLIHGSSLCEPERLSAKPAGSDHTTTLEEQNTMRSSRVQSSDRSLSDQEFCSLTDKTKSHLSGRRDKVCPLVAWCADDLAGYAGRPGALPRITPISSNLCSWFHHWMGDTRGRVNTNECVERQGPRCIVAQFLVHMYQCPSILLFVSYGYRMEKTNRKREPEVSRGTGIWS